MLGIPSPLFVSVIEDGLGKLSRESASSRITGRFLAHEVDQLFAKRGIDYTISAINRAWWRSARSTAAAR